jgi:hypothetical protein
LKPEWWGSPQAQEEKYQRRKKPVTRDNNNNNTNNNPRNLKEMNMFVLNSNKMYCSTILSNTLRV